MVEDGLAESSIKGEWIVLNLTEAGRTALAAMEREGE
jgi:hypothetical protein